MLRTPWSDLNPAGCPLQLFDLDRRFRRLLQSRLLTIGRAAAALWSAARPAAEELDARAGLGDRDGDGGESRMCAVLDVLSTEKVAGLPVGQVADVAFGPDWGTASGCVLLRRFDDGELWFGSISEWLRARLRLSWVGVHVIGWLAACAGIILLAVTRESVRNGSSGY